MAEPQFQPRGRTKQQLRLIRQHIEETLQTAYSKNENMNDNPSMPAMDFGSPVFPTDSMGLSIPALIKNSGRGLEDFPLTDLQQHLKPILQGLQCIDPRDILPLEMVPQGFGPRISSRECVRPIHHSITPLCNDNNTVRYIHMAEVPDQYSIGVFVFPPHAKIPLHDHPGMCVLSRILYGDITRTSLDLVRPSEQPPPPTTPPHNSRGSWLLPWTSLGWKSRDNESSNYGRPQGSRLAYRNHVDHLVAPACTALFPFEGNLHEFVAGPHGAAVLDVLLPPYDEDHDRNCTYYTIRECSPWEQENHERAVVWIVPTGRPEDFHCKSGSCGGLGDEDESSSMSDD